MTVLRIEGLTTFLPGRSPAQGDAPLHRELEMEVGPGELVTLEGPSGSGKTVLGTTALRLRPPPHAGSVFWGETEVAALSMRALRPLRRTHQAMLQHTGALLPPYLTLRSAMKESLKAVRRGDWSDREIEEVSELLGISSLLHRFPRHLSGGEQRRASLARLMLIRPALAFVDEPDAGLDGISQVEVMQALRSLVDETGAGVLLVTHQADLAIQFSDRRLKLEGGRVHAL